MTERLPLPILCARLRAARENGFLNARCRQQEAMVRAYGLWCWRMGLPLMWYGPRSTHSRLSRLHLELFTTASGALPVAAQAELIAFSARFVAARHASVTRDRAVWDRLEPGAVREFARGVFRILRRHGQGESGSVEVERHGQGRVVPFPAARSA